MNEVRSRNHAVSEPTLFPFQRKLKNFFKYAALSLVSATAVFLLGLLISTFPEDLPIQVKLMRALGVVLVPSSILLGGALLWNVSQQPDTPELQRLVSVIGGLIAMQFVVLIGLALAFAGT